VEEEKDGFRVENFCINPSREKKGERGNTLLSSINSLALL